MAAEYLTAQLKVKHRNLSSVDRFVQCLPIKKLSEGFRSGGREDKMKRIISCAILFTIFTVSIASARTYSRTEMKTFNISPNGKVIVENVNGGIRVESWDKNQVSMEATKTVRADDQEEADEYFDRLRIDIDSGDDYVEIHTRYPHEGWGGFWSWLFHGGSRYVNVEYVLKVPSTIKVDAQSTNGSIEVHSIVGSVRAGSTNGRLTFEEVGGEVDGSTTNGSITATISDGVKFRELNLRTTNGSIKTYCPENIDADLDAHTTNGNIQTEFPVTVRGNFSNKSLEGKINRGGNRIYLHTTNGSIEINKR